MSPRREAPPETTLSQPRASARRGRPPGATNLNPPTVTTLLTRCPACGSTNRDEYHHRDEQAYAGIAPDDKPYTHIVRRRTRCVDCGQHRIDKVYEYRPRNAPAL